MSAKERTTRNVNGGRMQVIQQRAKEVLERWGAVPEAPCNTPTPTLAPSPVPTGVKHATAPVKGYPKTVMTPADTGVKPSRNRAHEALCDDINSSDLRPVYEIPTARYWPGYGHKVPAAKRVWGGGEEKSTGGKNVSKPIRNDSLPGQWRQLGVETRQLRVELEYLKDVVRHLVREDMEKVADCVEGGGEGVVQVNESSGVRRNAAVEELGVSSQKAKFVAEKAPDAPKEDNTADQVPEAESATGIVGFFKGIFGTSLREARYHGRGQSYQGPFVGKALKVQPIDIYDPAKDPSRCRRPPHGRLDVNRDDDMDRRLCRAHLKNFYGKRCGGRWFR